MPDTDKGRCLLVGGLAAAALIGVVVFLLTRPSDGYLLRKGELDAAKHHMQLRQELAKLDAALAAQPPGDDAAARVDLEVRYATVQLELGASRFRDLPGEDLQHGIEAAQDGRYVAEPMRDRSKAIYDGLDARLDLSAVLAEIEEQRLPTGDGQRRVFLEKAIERSKSVGAFMHAYSLGPASEGFPIRARSLQREKRLCGNQRFADQPVAAIGTGFLIGPDRVLTAAHVLAGHNLPAFRFTLNFEVAKDGKNPKTAGQVYTPVAVFGGDKGRGKHDWVVVRLDRAVLGGRALPLAQSSVGPEMVQNAPIYMWGHSAGTPKKFVEGTVLLNQERYTIRVKLDAFGGDSGAPVFNMQHEVVGLLYGGSTDWVDVGDCVEVAAASIYRGGELVTRIEHVR